jgi:hypothetical protein
MTIIPCAKSEESGDIYVGTSFGFGQSIHHNILYQFQNNLPDAYSPSEIDKEISQDYYWGLNFEYVLFKKENFSNSIILSSSLQNSILKNQTPGYDLLQYFEDPQDLSDSILVRSSTRLDEKMNFNFINFDLLYRFKFKSIIKYGIALGPFFSIPISANSNEEYKIVEPLNTQFPSVQGFTYKNNNRTVVLYEGKINDVNPFYWGIKTNCFIEYEFWNLLKTTAEIGYSYPLSNFVKDSEWKIEKYYANLIFSIKLN